MFERFTERAREVVVRAQDQARDLGADHIGPEHLLLGLLAVDPSAAAHVLNEMGLTLEGVKSRVKEKAEETTKEGEAPLSGQIPFTPEAKKALDLSLREALSLGHNYIGTEHVLLGLVRLGSEGGVASAIFKELALGPDAVRDAVVRFLSARPEPPARPGAAAMMRSGASVQARRRVEHKVVTLDLGALDSCLERAAAGGWELVSVLPPLPGGPAGPLAFFKRRAPRVRFGHTSGMRFLLADEEAEDDGGLSA